VQKISPTPAFDPRTVQPVASRHTDLIIIIIIIIIIISVRKQDIAIHISVLAAVQFGGEVYYVFFIIPSL
jgi:hypothetical protein